MDIEGIKVQFFFTSLSTEDIPLSYTFFGTSIVELKSAGSVLLSLEAIFIEGVKKSLDADRLFFEDLFELAFEFLVD